jgi:GDP-4-dehydro-6-deoxy-D-mannose reductase
MKAFITGGTGFVGPHLVAHLEAAGDEVVLAPDENTGFAITDRETVAREIARVRPDAIYHLAARSNVAQSWQDPAGFLRVNVEGTQNVCDAARAASVARVLVVGSSEEYGRVDPGIDRVDEDTPLRPLSPYGVSTIAASYVALQSWLGGGVETVRVRAFNHTGPGQSPAFFVPGFANRVAQAERDGASTITAGSLDAVRDISDVRDVVRAYRVIVEHGAPGEVYNVCSGNGIAIGDIANTLLSQSTRPLRIETDPALLRPADIPRVVGDNSKLMALGWKPEFSLEETLSAVLQEARSSERR